MIHPSPRLLVAAATAFVGVGELSNVEHGPVVEMFLRQVGQPNGGAWSTAFVHHVGYWSHYDHDSGVSAWPLPPLADANALTRLAAERNVIRENPEPFDLFALYSPAKHDYVRSGIILTVGGTGILPDGARYHECITLEGDTNERVGSRGNTTRRAKRFLSHQAGDRFIRWMDLDPHNLPGRVGPDLITTVAGRMHVGRVA